MKFSAFRIRPLPVGGYLDFLFFTGVVKSCFEQLLLCLSLSSCGDTISPNFFFFFCKIRMSLHSFFICQCPFVHTVKQDESCSSSLCVSRTTMQGAFFKWLKEVDITTLLFHRRNTVSLKFECYKCVVYNLESLNSWSKRCFDKTFF